MPKLLVFNHISLYGYFVDGDGSRRWAQAAAEDAEWNAFVTENVSKGKSTLLMSRITYELMIQ